MNLQIIDLNKSFGEKTVFENFSHTFKSGCVTSICGSSGCGKTTLLRIIAGLDTDYKGIILPEKYTVSVAFQEPRLFPGATVLENVSVTDNKEKARSLLSELGIYKDSFKALPFELSGGMARRISLARAILKNADYYLFDEPFAGLDEVNAKITANVIKEYCFGKSCIIVTHNAELAKTITDEFLYL